MCHKLGRDHLAGLLLVAIGLGAVYLGRGYGLGSLAQVGPGLLPTAIAVILVIVGLSIFGAAFGVVNERDNGVDRDAATPADWRGLVCIVTGVLSFILLGTYGGLLPATFACVFLSALGDRSMSWRRASLLALAIASVGPAAFVYLLKLPFALLRWGD